MRCEFCVSQLVMWNRPLRDRVCGLLGISSYGDDPQRVIEEFQSQDKVESLAERINCSPSDLFLNIRERLAVSLRVPTSHPGTRPRKPQADDISPFFDEAFLTTVAGALGCPSELKALVPKLFDSQRMKKLAANAGIAELSVDLESDKLFWRLVSPNGRAKLYAFFQNLRDIWSILATILDEKACERLCRHLSCAPEDVFASILTRVRSAEEETDREVPPDEPHRRLDVLGVAKVQETLRAVANAYLRKDAIQIAEDLWKSDTGATGAGVLLPIIEFNVQRSYKSAVKRLLEAKRSIGSLGLAIVRLGVPDYDERIRLQCATEQNARRGDSLVVRFSLPPFDRWGDLLRLDGPVECLAHVAEHLPVAASDIHGAGQTLDERVLTHAIPALVTPARQVWDAMLAHGDDSLIQALILSGANLDDPFGVTRSVDVTGKASLMDQSVVTSCSTPMDVFGQVKRSYEEQGLSFTLK